MGAQRNRWRLTGALVLTAAGAAHAQVVLDGSLEPKGDTAVAPGQYRIEQRHGRTSDNGRNLFHSFERFDLQPGERATFAGASSIRNVISRVTGGSPSTVDGAIRSEIPRANFFFLNPAGISFGPSAQLEGVESLHLSTGHYVELGSAAERFAADTSLPLPLLEVDASGFGFLGDRTPAAIVLTGGEDALELPGELELHAGDIRVSALTVNAGEIDIESRGNVALEDVSLLRASGPGIAVAARDGELSVQGGRLDTVGGGALEIDVRTLQIGHRAFVGTRALGEVAGGDVSVRASESAQLEGGAVLATLTAPFGGGDAGSLDLKTPELHLTGIASASGTTLLGTFVNSRAGGGPGNVDVEVDRLQVLQGAHLGQRQPLHTLGEGGVVQSSERPGTRVRVTATESVLVSGTVPVPGSSAVLRSSILNDNVHGSSAQADPAHERVIELRGPGGRPVPRVVVTEGGRIASRTAGRGDAADIHIHAGELSVSDGGAIDSRTLGAGTLGTHTPPSAGRAGHIEITAERSVTVSGGDSLEGRSRIDARTQGSGDGGTVEIRAPLLVVDGGSLRASTAARSQPDGAGDAGDVDLRVGRLEVLNGGEVRADSTMPLSKERPEDPDAFSGNAGDVRVHADTVIVRGSGPDPLSEQLPKNLEPSQISSASATRGDAGSVSIRARRVELEDGGEISVEASHTGQAGTVHIDAEVLRARQGNIRTRARQGNGGGIQIEGGRILDLVQSEITTSVSSGKGNGGDIHVSPELVLLRHSRIAANAHGGNGGNVRMKSPFLVKDTASSIEASSELGRAGTTELPSPEALLSGLTPLPAGFAAGRALLRPSCAARDPQASGSLVVESTRGVPGSPERWLLALDADQGPELPDVALAAAPAAAALRQENFPEALREFGRLGSDAGPGRERARALRGAAQVQQLTGDYGGAVAGLLGAVLAAEQAGDPVQVAAALGSLGNAYVALGELEVARDHLQRGIEMAREAGALAQASGMWSNLGNLHAIAGRHADALAAYGQAVKLARAVGRPLVAAQALANAARVALFAEVTERAAARLAQARAALENLERTPQQAQALIHIAHTEVLWAERGPEVEHVLRAHADLQQAAELATEFAAPRTLSYALGALGALYAREGRDDEALAATQRALLAAQQAGAPEALYRWHAQSGELLARLGHAQDSLSAYRSAARLLGELRPEGVPSYGDTGVAYRTAVAPVYEAMVEGLLRAADASVGAPGEAELLREVREVVEAHKAAELRDYFRDPCAAELAARERPIEDVSPDAAIVYPLLLSERVELLVSLRGELRRYAPPGARTAVLEEQTRALRQALEDPDSAQAYQAPAQQLYRWLVEPYLADLERAGVRTLVFVPAGVLRSIPLAALHDGSDFLIRRFALVVTPGLSLMDPQPLQRGALNPLVLALSQSEQGFPALPHVRAEAEAIRSRFGGTLLMDAQFTPAEVERVLAEQAHAIVHIASHAAFSGESADSFVLAHGGRISTRDLGAWIGRTRYRKAPLELLVLSACETAAGDDRSALGLAGMAIQAGARSALGSLWSVDDRAAARLMDAFYARLGDAQHSRAQALRAAQLTLLDDAELAHPSYWAPFTLISNWL